LDLGPTRKHRNPKKMSVPMAHAGITLSKDVLDGCCHQITRQAGRWAARSPRHYQARSSVVTRSSGPANLLNSARFGRFSMGDGVLHSLFRRGAKERRGIQSDACADVAAW
jgi:hypothetical protein